jgi:hypothetical protein
VSGTGPGPLPHTRRLGQAGGAGTAVTVPWCASPSRHDVTRVPPRPRRTTTPSRPTRRRTRLVSARVRLPVAKRPRAGAGPTILSAVRRVVRGCV